MTLPVTAFVGAVYCAAAVHRDADGAPRLRLSLSDHGDAKLIAASRSHGNLAEHAPIVVILLGLLEMARANHMALMVIGALFLIGASRISPGCMRRSNRQAAGDAADRGAATWITLLALGGGRCDAGDGEFVDGRNGGFGVGADVRYHPRHAELVSASMA